MGLSLDDKYAVTELVYKAHHYADFGEPELQGPCYTEDYVIEIEGVGRYEGRQWEVDHGKWSYRRTQGKNRHFITNLWVEGEGDKAVAHYLMMNANASGGLRNVQLVTTGYFQDTAVRTPDGWVIASRRFQTDQVFTMENDGV